MGAGAASAGGSEWYSRAVIARLALFFTRLASRWVPSAFTIAVLLTVLAFVLGIAWGEASPLEVTRAWGDGFWTLLSFGMQMCLVVFSGYVVAVAAPVRALLDRLASIPRSDTGAVMALALIAMVVAWIHWGMGLIAGAVLVGFMARRHPGADYRLLVAVSYFGLGATWHAGLSGSVPLLLATPQNFMIQQGLLDEVIPIQRTLLSPFNLLFTAGVTLALTLLAGALHPRPEDRVRADAEAAERLAAFDAPPRPARPTPAERLEHSFLVNGILGALGLAWLVLHLRAGGGLSAVNLDVVNFAFLALGILLHGRPAALGHAAVKASEPLHGIVLQFPLYAGMFGIIKGTALAQRIARAFTRVASRRTLPLLTFWYSTVLNYFVPSGGSKWAIEAPYLLRAARELDVPVERLAMAYAYGDMGSNLIQPFWAIPLLAVARLEFKDILGYECIAFLAYAALATGALLVAG
ncbi:MAG: short-chain fatty acid transporter [Deltaproteobacteria bacterium]|nr:short-chain fatty acid transporter [Deltaproteobacteria bacterium]